MRIITSIDNGIITAWYDCVKGVIAQGDNMEEVITELKRVLSNKNKI